MIGKHALAEAAFLKVGSNRVGACFRPNHNILMTSVLPRLQKGQAVQDLAIAVRKQ